MSRVVFLSGDLMFASRVRGAAEAHDWDFQFSASLPEDCEDVGCVILDLATRSGLTDSIVSDCQNRCPEAKLIAFGPHVHTERLDAARRAGISTVMTRGQFDQQISKGLFD